MAKKMYYWNIDEHERTFPEEVYDLGKPIDLKTMEILAEMLRQQRKTNLLLEQLLKRR